MATFPWRCEHPVTKDVKFAAIEDHKNKLEDKGYECVVYPDMDFDTLTPDAPTNIPEAGDE